MLLVCFICLSVSLVGCSPSRETNNNLPKQSQKIERSSVNDNKEIVYQLEKDIDGDKKTEKLVFDIDKEDKLSGEGSDSDIYTRLLIYEQRDGIENLVFDSEKAGIEINGDLNTRISDEKYIWIEDKNKNNIPEIYLEEEVTYDLEIPRVAIIEYIKGTYKVLFNDCITDFEYSDFDNNGKYELYGSQSYFGDVGDAISFIHVPTVFVLKDDEYVPSKLMTINFAKGYLEYLKGDIDYSLVLYGILGERDKGIKLIKDNKKILEKRKDPDGKNYSVNDYIEEFEQYINDEKEEMKQWD